MAKYPRLKEIYKKYAQNIPKIYPKNIFSKYFWWWKIYYKYDEKYFKKLFLLPSFGTINIQKIHIFLIF